MTGAELRAQSYTNVNFTTIGGTTNGYGRSGQHGSSSVPGITLYFIGITPTGTGNFEVFDVSGMNEPGVSNSDPFNQAYFKISTLSTPRFNMNQFDVYNTEPVVVTITVRGWSDDHSLPPGSGVPNVEQIIDVPPHGWSTFSLTGFEGLKNVTIDFPDGAGLLFNQFHVQKVKENQVLVSGTLLEETITLEQSTTLTAYGGSGTGAYEFRQNGGTGSVSFSGSGNSRTIYPLTAGSVELEVRRLGDSNYKDSEWSSAGTLTIQKVFGVESLSDPLTYNGNALEPHPVVKDGGIVLTEGVDYALQYSNNTQAGTASVSVYGINNYGGVREVDFPILPKALTVGGLAIDNKVYDGTVAAVIGGAATLEGAVLGDDVALDASSASAAFAAADVAEGIAVAVSGYALSGSAAANYSLTQPAGFTADITPKALTVGGLAIDNKVYDGTTSAIIVGAASLEGAVVGDDVALDASSASAAFAAADVAEGIAVAVSGYALSGSA
ncbi:YDG domain-containing protein, partial [Geofilum rhodophaeum]|uniref:YDG domain-containing protein n=1 Tax=Geofilum rhodophaeum TaxID=1965019 RepID=UPI00197AFCF6